MMVLFLYDIVVVDLLFCGGSMMSTVPDLLDSIPRLTPVQQEKLDNLFERFRTQMLQKIIEREKKQAEDVHRMKNIVLL